MMLSKGLYMLLSLVIVASLMLAACALEGATPSPEVQIPMATAEVAATPTAEQEGEKAVETEPPVIAPQFKNPDTFTYWMGDPQTLDPAWSSLLGDFEAESKIYEGLVRYNKDPSAEFVPMLATSWEVNTAGDEWTFKVRQGVTFHAGGRLEPHDVAYSLQRALLMDRVGGLQWMTLEAFFGLYAIEELAIEIAGVASFEEVSQERLVATCERVKRAVSADDAAGTVTYRLTRPTPWLLSLLAHPAIGAVVDMEWMVEQGAWDGDCGAWVQYHDPPPEDTVLYNQGNGTGPYILDRWTSGEELVLLANESYWRPAGDLMWEGGPSGAPRIKRVVIKNIAVLDWDARRAMFQAGEVDTLGIPKQELPRFEPYFKTLCQADGRCEEVNPDGYIQAWRDLPLTVQWYVVFNQRINVEGGNPFVGSGQLDGQGVPPDFFQDVHVRRAFNYCFDFDTMIAGLLYVDGVQPQGPIIPGLMGYREGEAPLYSYDLTRCEREFRQAFGGALWDNGFYVQLPNGREPFEILKAGVEAVNSNFHIEVIDLDWPVLDNHRRAGKLPVSMDGWQEDFHDPHSWVYPLLHSRGYSGRDINMPEESAAEYDALIEKAASLTAAEARRPLYEQLQLKAMEDGIYIWMFQSVVPYHLQSWIKGYYYNPASQVTYDVYALSKEAP